MPRPSAAPPRELDAASTELLGLLEQRLSEPSDALLDALRERDALLDRPCAGRAGAAPARASTPSGALLVRRDDGTVTALHAGEVHLDDRML